MLNFVTSNPHKFREAARILCEWGIGVEWLKIRYAELQEDSISRIVSSSLDWLDKKVERPFFIDDAGMFVRALSGFPGPYSSYVFRTLGNEGILKLIEGKGDRKAAFRSVVGLMTDEGARLFAAETHGTIAKRVRGTAWGFDPIFIPDGEDRTYSELGLKKDGVSHRRKSLEKMAHWFLHKD